MKSENSPNKLRLLFLCTGNSCRSQMAEGWARHLKSDEIEAFSAGVDPQGLNPLAVLVMQEAGVDIGQQRSKHVREFAGCEFDFVVTVCGDARDNCPALPTGGVTVHVGFDDPPRLAADAGSQDEALAHYRRVRDEIRRFIDTLPDSLQSPVSTGTKEPDHQSA